MRFCSGTDRALRDPAGRSGYAQRGRCARLRPALRWIQRRAGLQIRVRARILRYDSQVTREVPAARTLSGQRRVRMLIIIAWACAWAIFAISERAEASHLRLGLGAHYWLVEAGVFDVDFAIEVPVGSVVSVGGRFGVMLTSGP